MSSDNDFMGHFADLQKMRRKALTTLEVNNKTKITEKRAPTDESVRLLNEMQQAAEDRLVCVLSCHATPFSFTAHVFEEPSNMFALRMRVRFSLGESQFDISMPLDPKTASGPTEYIDAVHKLLAEKVAAEILVGSFSELVKFRSFR